MQQSVKNIFQISVSSHQGCPIGFLEKTYAFSYCNPAGDCFQYYLPFGNFLPIEDLLGPKKSQRAIAWSLASLPWFQSKQVAWQGHLPGSDEVGAGKGKNPLPEPPHDNCVAIRRASLLLLLGSAKTMAYALKALSLPECPGTL